MLKMISQRHRETYSQLRLQFDLKGEPKGNGYSFPLLNKYEPPMPCKQKDDGSLEYIECSENECLWWKNYLKVKDDREHYNEPYIYEDKHSWIEPAKGICYCGETVYLTDEYMGACECRNCGQWYNLFGQEINNPSEWEEEE